MENAMKVPTPQEVQAKHAAKKAFTFQAELERFAKFATNVLSESKPNKKW
jgi:hypothetical protein